MLTVPLVQRLWTTCRRNANIDGYSVYFVFVFVVVVSRALCTFFLFVGVGVRFAIKFLPSLSLFLLAMFFFRSSPEVIVEVLLGVGLLYTFFLFVIEDHLIASEV